MRTRTKTNQKISHWIKNQNNRRIAPRSWNWNRERGEDQNLEGKGWRELARVPSASAPIEASRAKSFVWRTEGGDEMPLGRCDWKRTDGRYLNQDAIAVWNVARGDVRLPDRDGRWRSHLRITRLRLMERCIVLFRGELIPFFFNLFLV